MEQADGEFPIVGVSIPWKTEPLVERAITVSRALAVKATETLLPIFLVIHNIEGPGLRNEIAQEALAALLVNSIVENGVAAIRLVASMDHVDTSALLWSPATMANFSWIYKEIHTHRPYVKELAMLDDYVVKKKAEKRKVVDQVRSERVLHVLKSLAPRYAEVLQTLARLQLDIPSQEEDTWIDYIVFRDKCKAECIVTKDTQLRNFLTELVDHGLLEHRTNEEYESVTIPYSRAKLREIMAYTRGD
jgi:hypothetical protein